jgi:hypothetical protein
MRSDGSIKHFQISSAWWSFRPIYRILRSVPGVRDIKRQWFNEDRIRFVYRDRNCLVNEPFGDNSRYLIHAWPVDETLDLRPIHDAFLAYRMVFTFDRDFRNREIMEHDV